MKLIDYLSLENPFKDTYIDLLKMEHCFKELYAKYHDKIIFTSLGINTNYNDFSIQDDNSGKIILSCNADSDFPPPKKTIFSYQDNAFDKDMQNMLDNMPYEDKINVDILNQIPEKIEWIFCHAIGKMNPKLIMLPLGRDFKNRHLFDLIDTLPKNVKDILCYYNCTLPPSILHWYGMIRTNIVNLIHDNDLNFITVEYCYQHPRTYNDDITMNYYKKILASKFMICPRGCGIDTYRMWDCIYLGCVPIIEKYEGYQQMEDLPILFIDSWHDIKKLTVEKLEVIWNNMLEREYNYNKLNIDYWKECILDKLR